MAAQHMPLTAQTQSVDTRIGNLSFELGLPTEDIKTPGVGQAYVV
jgi:hypothetical protein